MVTVTPMPQTSPASNAVNQDLFQRAARLGLYGATAHWSTIGSEPLLRTLIEYEEEERSHRSLERRLRNAKLGRFKPMADFDWTWPKKIDRDHIEEIFSLEFVAEAANVVLVGPNGVGKTMIAQNLAYRAILSGRTACFLTASELLNDLAARESSSALMRRLRHYSQPGLLVIDEVGYLASSSEHADLLFEIVTRRYQEKSIVLTTNKGFREWTDVFPSSTAVVTLVDRLTHKAEIIEIDGESYRRKEAEARKKERQRRLSARRKNSQGVRPRKATPRK